MKFDLRAVQSREEISMNKPNSDCTAKICQQNQKRFDMESVRQARSLVRRIQQKDSRKDGE